MQTPPALFILLRLVYFLSVLPPTPTGSTPTMRGVSLDEFPDHVAEMHMHSDIGFSEEYDVGTEDL